MKVLHISSGNLFGGVERLLVTLEQEKVHCSAMEPSFALAFKGRVFSELEQAGADVHWLGEVKIGRPWTMFKARRVLAAILECKSFDVVVCHMPWAQFIFGPVAKKKGIPQVFWCHDIPNGTQWIEKLAKQVRPDFVIANSHYTRQMLPRLYPDIKSGLFYNPVVFPGHLNKDLLREKIRSVLGIPEDALVIIQASRLEAWKGHTVLLSALGELRDMPSWICLIAGGAQRPHEVEYLAQLKEIAERLGIADQVKFLGHRTDVYELFACADIFCQPNISPEPFGIVLVEALYAGLPVVTISFGGGAEIVDDFCGRKVPVNDPQALAAVLRSLAGDRDLRFRLGSAGPARARALCDPLKQVQELGQVLLTVCNHLKRSV